MKRILKFTFAIALIIAALSISDVIAADDFEGNESKYIEMCKRTSLNVSEAATCKRFKEFMQNKNTSIKGQIDALNADLAATLADVNAMIIKIEQYRNDIIIKEAEIVALQENIKALEVRIAAREVEIRDRMFALQSIINSNAYIQFVMGASSFEDFLRRNEGFKEITQYDRDLIDAFLADKEALAVDKGLLEDSKTVLVGLQTASEVLKVEYEAKAAALGQQINSQIEVSAELASSIDNINTEASIPPSEGGSGGVPSSKGWLLPMSTGRMSAGTWAYPGGGAHNGVDLAGPIGRPILAPVNGYLVYAKDSCATNNGGPGDPCYNSWIPNYVIMVAQVNGMVYSIELAHNQKGAAAASGWNGQVRTVSQGEQISAVGNSGYSFGPHIHHTIINHGPNVSVQSVINKLYTNGDFLFGLGGGNPSSKSCVNRGYPCLERPEEMYGVYVGQWW